VPPGGGDWSSIMEITINSPSLPGCKGLIVLGTTKYGDCFLIKFTDSQGFFKLPCTQAIHKRYVHESQ